MSLKCRLNVASQIGGVIESRFNIALTSFQYRCNIVLMSLQCRLLKCRLNVASQIGGVIESRFNIGGMSLPKSVALLKVALTSL